MVWRAVNQQQVIYSTNYNGVEGGKPTTSDISHYITIRMWRVVNQQVIYLTNSLLSCYIVHLHVGVGDVLCYIVHLHVGVGDVLCYIVRLHAGHGTDELILQRELLVSLVLRGRAARDKFKPPFTNHTSVLRNLAT